MENTGIKGDEVAFYRNLNKIVKDEKHLKDGKIRRVYGNKNFLLIVCDKDSVPKLIGKNGIIIKKIEKSLSKQTRVISDSLKFHDFIKEVLFSSTILGINIVYAPDGTKYKIRIPANERIIMPLSPEDFANITNSVFNTPVELVFE